MKKENMYDKEQILIMEEKEKKIFDILTEGDITFGMAKSIIERIEADLMKKGDTFLKQSRFENVSLVQEKGSE